MLLSGAIKCYNWAVVRKQEKQVISKIVFAASILKYYKNSEPKTNMPEITWDLLWDDRIINWLYHGQRLLVKQLLFYEVCVIYSQGVTAKEKRKSVYL